MIFARIAEMLYGESMEFASDFINFTIIGRFIQFYRHIVVIMVTMDFTSLSLYT